MDRCVDVTQIYCLLGVPRPQLLILGSFPRSYKGGHVSVLVFLCREICLSTSNYLRNLLHLRWAPYGYTGRYGFIGYCFSFLPSHVLVIAGNSLQYVPPRLSYREITSLAIRVVDCAAFDWWGFPSLLVRACGGQMKDSLVDKVKYLTPEDAGFQFESSRRCYT